jgi:uridine kinase
MYEALSPESFCALLGVAAFAFAAPVPPEDRVTMVLRRDTLLTIGIAGASGSGKSYLLDHLLACLNTKRVTHFDLDGYHRHGREERRRLHEYPDELKSNDLARAAADLAELIMGRTIAMPTYNHSTGTFGPRVLVKSKPIVFVEGLHSAMINRYSRAKLVDICVFLYPDDELRRRWKAKRDINDRGYSSQAARDEIVSREPFVVTCILPQTAYADIVIHVAEDGSRYQVLATPQLQSNGSVYLQDALKSSLTIDSTGAVAGFPDCRELHADNSSRVDKFIVTRGRQLGLIGRKYSTGIAPVAEPSSLPETLRVLLVLILAMAFRRST